MSLSEETISFEIAKKLYSDYTVLANQDTLSDRIVKNTGSSIFSEYPDLSPREIYNQLLKSYPNETIIKGNFVNKFLLKSRSHVAIFELNVNSSRADICKINDASYAFEIKTDLDSPFRLEKQLKDYFDVFEYVSIICSAEKYPLFSKHITSTCGVYTYTVNRKKDYKFKLEKKAVKNSNFMADKQLNMLTKGEIIRHFGISESLSKDELVEFVLQKNAKRTINSTFKKILKNRYQNRWDFFVDNHSQILEIDYQWFFKNNIPPNEIYNY